MAKNSGGLSVNNNVRSVGLGVLTAIVTAGMLYYAIRVGSAGSGAPALLPHKKGKDDDNVGADGTSDGRLKSSDLPDITKPTGDATTKKMATTTTTTKDIEADTNKKVEEIDRRGKALFKSKNYLDAAACFSEALDLLSSNAANNSNSNNSVRQIITLTNNRSAMYEKAGMAELAVADCDVILAQDVTHQKARVRKLRLLESQGRWSDALVEVCALQLRFMQVNREKLRMGVQVTPPIPQSKIEEIMGKLLPGEIERHMADLEKSKSDKGNKDGTGGNPLPSVYTILQLLQSFSGYNGWMGRAARGGSVQTLSDALDVSTNTPIDNAKILFRRGRRYAFDRMIADAVTDFEAAYAIVVKEDDYEAKMGEDDSDDFPRLLEWVGMGRHLTYNLDGASKCYERCSELEPTNAEILVKRAGVKMDASDHTSALALFEKALELDPSCTDALLHRANLYVLQSQPLEAKSDLDAVIALQPNHLLAHLRLATVFMSMGDDKMDDANRCLEKAEDVSNGESSEVHSYRGEMHFARGEMEMAKDAFKKAVECDPRNPTPHVNAALAVMNSPGTNGGPPDIPEAITMLEQALKIDPQFHAAYVHLGQLKLTMATNLNEGREVIQLYDRGLKLCCRTPDELKDIVSMRILTVAQIDAATALKMDTLNMQ